MKITIIDRTSQMQKRMQIQNQEICSSSEIEDY